MVGGTVAAMGLTPAEIIARYRAPLPAPDWVGRECDGWHKLPVRSVYDVTTIDRLRHTHQLRLCGPCAAALPEGPYVTRRPVEAAPPNPQQVLW